MEYKQVDIYADQRGNLILIANGIIDKWGGIIANINVVEQLNPPFRSDQLVFVLNSVLERCHSKVPIENEVSIIEKHTNIKGFDKATKGMKLVVLGWSKDEGYSLTPTKKQKKGFRFLDDKKIDLGYEILEEDIVASLENAFENSMRGI